MRKMMIAAALGVGLVVAGPAQMALGSMPAAAQGHGGGRGGGFGGGHGGGGWGGHEGFGGHEGGGGHGGGWGGHEGWGGRGWGRERGEYRGGWGGFRGGWGGYGGFGYGAIGYGGFGYGCCGYYGGYYDGAGFLLGAAAVAGVTALAVDSAYDRPYYDTGYIPAPAPVPYYDAPIVPAGEFRPATFDRRTLVERCARAAESDAAGWASTAKFARVETFDRDGPSARVDGVLSVGVGDGRYDREGFPQGFPQGGHAVRDVRFTCALDGNRIVDLRVDRP